MEYQRQISRLAILMLFPILISTALQGQTDTPLRTKLPSVTIKTTEGKQFNTADISNNGKPVILCFWKTCCKPPENLLAALAEVYNEWKEKTGVIIYAVSVDDARSSSRVQPFAESKGWEFEMLLDPNSDFKRAMNVNALPHTFIIDGQGHIVYQKVLYEPGTEEEIGKELFKISNLQK
ncbi:MAG: TlpA disulfide reductase family protein [Bacteroidetes bacterium]|nr:TlpA disulfide reductase family protein [Bacteroidota bacterium]